LFYGVEMDFPSERLPDVPKPTLDSRRNMQVARLGGAAERRAFGGLRDQPEETSLQQLLAISTDPAVWGIVLGNNQADIELRLAGDERSRILEWARRAGADEQVARQQREWRLAQPWAWIET
jgi:hypothetical protein